MHAPNDAVVLLEVVADQDEIDPLVEHRRRVEQIRLLPVSCHTSS